MANQEEVGINVEEYYARMVDTLWHKGLHFMSSQEKETWVEQPRASLDMLEQFYEQLAMIKNELYSVKLTVHSTIMNVQDNDHISDVDALARWRSYTSYTHPMRKLPQKVLAKFGEIEGINNYYAASKLITQAYCKFLQIVIAHSSIVIPTPNGKDGSCQKFRSLHLCESPGGFIFALKHFLGPRDRLWDWQMNSLNPHFEYHSFNEKHFFNTEKQQSSRSQFLNNDLLILGNERRLAFGWDESGDILRWDQAYIEKLIKQTNNIGNSGKFHLVTADAGIDCTDEPWDQENRIRLLIEHQIRIALESLSTGGNFLLKAYTFFEQKTIDLLALLCANFSNIHFLKPPSSKPGNSELYLLCLGYKSGPKLSAITLCSPFLKKIIECARFFARHQIDFIKFNLCTFRKLSQSERSKIDMQKCMAQEVMVQYLWQNIKPIMQKNVNDTLVLIEKEAPWHALWNIEEGINDGMCKQSTCNKPTFLVDKTFCIEPTDLFQWLSKAENFSEILKEGLAFARLLLAKNKNEHILINKLSRSLFVPSEWLASDNCPCQDICDTNPKFRFYFKSCELLPVDDKIISLDLLTVSKIRMNWLKFLLQLSNPNDIEDETNMNIMQISSESKQAGLDPILIITTMLNEWIVNRFSASVFIMLFAMFKGVHFFDDEANGHRYFYFYGPSEKEKLELIHRYLSEVKSATCLEESSQPTGAILMRFVPTRFFATVKDFHTKVVNFNKHVHVLCISNN